MRTLFCNCLPPPFPIAVYLPNTVPAKAGPPLCAPPREAKARDQTTREIQPAPASTYPLPTSLSGTSTLTPLSPRRRPPGSRPRAVHAEQLWGALRLRVHHLGRLPRPPGGHPREPPPPLRHPQNHLTPLQSAKEAQVVKTVVKHWRTRAHMGVYDSAAGASLGGWWDCNFWECTPAKHAMAVTKCGKGTGERS